MKPAPEPQEIPAAFTSPGEGRSEPPSLKELFKGFASVGISGFGGVLPFARRMLVEERKWLTPEDFNGLLGLCQFLPGPNVINLSVAVGSRYRGISGAFVCVAGLLGGPLVVILFLGMLYDRYGELPQVQGMLRGIAAVGCGLLFATAFSMGQSIKYKRIFLPFSMIAFVAIALLRWPLPPVMVGLAVSSALVAYFFRKHHGPPG